MQETMLQEKEEWLELQHRQLGEGKGSNAAEGGGTSMRNIDSKGDSEAREALSRGLGSTSEAFNQQRLLERSLRSADCVIQGVIKALKLQDLVSPVTVLGARASVLLLQSFLVGLATAAGFAIRVLGET